MYCSKCGKELPEGERYCYSCGNPVEKKNLFNRNTIIVAVVVAGIILMILFLSLGNGKKESADSTIPEEIYTVAETEQTVEASEDLEEEVTEPLQKQEVAEYSVIAANGETLSVVPGFAKVMCTCEYIGIEREDASIHIPSLESFTNGEYGTNDETYTEEHYERIFSCNQPSDGTFMDDYVAELVDNYGFTLENTINVSYDQKVYFLNYEGEITHGADEWVDAEYDISIMFYSEFDSSGVCFRYPSEVDFSFDGDSQTYYSCLDTEAEYKKENGSNKFTVTGWGKTTDDFIILGFNDEVYKAGDIITMDDLVQQQNAGENSLCIASIFGPLVSGERVVGIVDSEDFIDSRIEILEKSDRVTAIHYYFEVLNNSSKYILEGVVAAETSDRAASNMEDRSGNNSGNDADSNDDPDFSVEEKEERICTFCDGSGGVICSFCGGDTFEQCDLCGGIGYYYDSYDELDLLCKGCNGRGSTPCYNSQCVNGQVTCRSCMGTGLSN